MSKLPLFLLCLAKRDFESKWVVQFLPTETETCFLAQFSNRRISKVKLGGLEIFGFKACILKPDYDFV